MARVVAGPKRAAIDPLKHSQPLGGALVFLGLARSMPVMHGSQGCASFAKALLTRHFREPVPLQTTAVTEVAAVLGAGELLTATLDAIRAKQRPEVIGVLTTGLTEVNGEDVAGELRAYADRLTEADAPLVVFVSTPDFHGGLSDGWAAALEALMRSVPQAGDAPQVEEKLDDPERIQLPVIRPLPPRGGAEAGRFAVLAGPSLTAADLDEIAGLVRAFGLDPVVVPDLSASLDGHLAGDWSPLTTGGTSVAGLRSLGGAEGIVAAGATAAGAGEILAARAGAPLYAHDHLSGLRPADALVADLLAHTGRPVPDEVRRWRSRLADTLLDSHFVLGGARVAVAMEPEALTAVASLLHDAGAEIVTAVSPAPAGVLAQAPCAEVVIGDLSDLEERAREAGAELVVASSHARAHAARIGAAHLAAGFPVYDRLGAQLRGTAGYRGSLQLLTDAANQLLDHQSSHGHSNHGHPNHGHARERHPRPGERAGAASLSHEGAVT